MTHKKRKATVFLTSLLCILLFTSCGNVEEESKFSEVSPSDPFETVTETETETETKNEADENAPKSLDELVANRFVIACTEDVNWKEKLLATDPAVPEIVNVYEGKIHENGKRMIFVSLISVTKSEITELTELAFQLHIDEAELTEIRIQMQCNRSRGEHFLTHVSTPTDILLKQNSGGTGAGFILYATDAEIEQYAKCSYVSSIIDGELMNKGLSGDQSHDG